MAENLRQIDYIIPESFHGHTVEAFLRSEGYSRTTLYHLRNTRSLSTAETKTDGIDGLVLNGHRSYLKEVLATGDRLRCNILETEDSPHVVETEIPLSIVYGRGYPGRR